MLQISVLLLLVACESCFQNRSDGVIAFSPATAKEPFEKPLPDSTILTMFSWEEIDTLPFFEDYDPKGNQVFDEGEHLLANGWKLHAWRVQSGYQMQCTVGKFSHATGKLKWVELASQVASEGEAQTLKSEWEKSKGGYIGSYHLSIDGHESIPYDTIWQQEIFIRE